MNRPSLQMLLLVLLLVRFAADASHPSAAQSAALIGGGSLHPTSVDVHLKDTRWWSLHEAYLRPDFDLFKARSHFTRQQWATFSARRCGFDPAAIRAALQGVNLALHECERQMSTERWNCSRLPQNYRAEAGNIFGQLLKKGIPETAFALAIVSAGVTASIASECRRSLRCCPCRVTQDDPERGLSPLRSAASPAAARYAGCDHNVRFAGAISRKLLDRPESGRDVRHLAMLHNFNAGRRAVVRTMEVKCVCHGTSGSCTHNICWREVASFQKIGEFLKYQYKEAVKVEQASPVKIYLDQDLQSRKSRRGGRSSQQLRQQRHKRRRGQRQRRRRRRRLNLVKAGRSPQQPGSLPRRRDLVYYESVSEDFFCEPNHVWSLPGVHQRVCSINNGSCSSICCSGTYRIEHYKHVDKKCNCRFVWCCDVKCETCITDKQRKICD
ncbi:hypothetical protein BOX15_Mlig008298g1 [Macrostomum lignano]|uniref:Protein Wnt n=2 Tax=Macrostomum lignano TaxID=282301 RepID=A0A267F6A3_9PLAT|nr:hypothetical protein BOX15_Mlig008298g1 [Macrostomum lignano]